MFKKNDGGKWYCTLCGELATEHTQEEITQCSTETIVRKDGTAITYIDSASVECNVKKPTKSSGAGKVKPSA